MSVAALDEGEVMDLSTNSITSLAPPDVERSLRYSVTK